MLGRLGPLARVLDFVATAAPGVLPLLSFTLDELYRRTRDNNSNELTSANYDDLGRLVAQGNQVRRIEISCPKALIHQ